MKKRWIWWMLAAVLLLCAGCGSRKEPAVDTPEQTQEQTVPTEPPASEPTPVEPPAVEETDWTAMYAPVLDALCDVLYNGVNDGEEYPLLPTGISELAMWSNRAEALEDVDYAFADLNDDGTAELLVFEYGEILTGAYTLVRGELTQFLDGWYRNVYYLLEDGRIFNQGSGGAAYAIFGVYHLSDYGSELVCEDYYFTDVEEGTEDRLIFFHNTTGEWDTEASERFAGTEDEFWAKADELSANRWMPELTPLSAYEYTGPINQPLDCKVRLDYEEDVNWWTDEFDTIGDYFPELQPTGEPYEVSVVFSSEEGVKQFKLLSLVLTDVDAAGNPSFDVTELCVLPELKAGVPLSVPMTFPGDMPTVGFSYRENGAERQFTVSQSGRDGSLVVVPIA